MSEKRRPDPSHTRRHVPLDSRPPAERIPSLARPEEAPTQVTRRPEIPAESTPKRKPGTSRSSVPPSRRDPGRASLAVPWWGFVIVILAVAAITCGMWYVVLSNKGSASTAQGASPTPIFVVITNTPTLGASAPEETQEESPPAATQEAAETAPTEETPPTEEPADENPGTPIQVGDQIVINGTEGAGLAVRQGPGLEYTYFFVANDGEAYTVEDGPRVMDDYIWWYIVDPEDEDRSGWAVEDFMEVTGS